MSPVRQTRPAENLDEIYYTVSTQPLITPEEFHAFYRSEVNDVRGGDKIGHMALGLQRSFGGAFYRTFLMGHPGVGKSTEMTRLSEMVGKQYRILRFSAQKDLNAAGFQPFDVLLVMMIKLHEEMSKPVAEGGLGHKPSAQLKTRIRDWFATEKCTTTQDMATGIGGSAGVKPSPVATAISGLIGLFAEVKGEIKFTYDRKKEIVEYRLNTMATLLDLLNQYIDECNIALKNATQQEWLFIGEDFDKAGIPVPLIETLFISYANIFSELRTHLIFSIPVALAYSEKAAQLPLPRIPIPDTPVFKQDHAISEAGRQAVRTVLEARVKPELFEVGQEDRLIVASGGNLRDLFEMVGRAADNAALRKDSNGKISAADVMDAINEKRSDYVRRLGTGPFDVQIISYEEKSKLLLKIYHQEPGNDVPNPVLYSLLRARAVQEFNGTRWFGVHPLVVKTLEMQGILKTELGGPVLGGAD